MSMIFRNKFCENLVDENQSFNFFFFIILYYYFLSVYLIYLMNFIFYLYIVCCFVDECICDVVIVIVVSLTLSTNFLTMWIFFDFWTRFFRVFCRSNGKNSQFLKFEFFEWKEGVCWDRKKFEIWKFWFWNNFLKIMFSKESVL